MNAKPALARVVQRGQRSARVSGTFAAKRHGHLLFRDIETPDGELEHLWINYRALGQMPQILLGSRVSFMADLQPYRKADGTESVRLEDIQEVRVL